MNDLDKHLLEQARIEVEHTRSWPVKLLAFYVAINFGIATAIATLERSDSRVMVSYWIRLPAALLVLVFLGGAWVHLLRNHRSYLVHRNMQVRFQQKHRPEFEPYGPPSDWFTLNDPIHWKTRGFGWLSYLFVLLFVTAMSLYVILFA